MDLEGGMVSKNQCSRREIRKTQRQDRGRKGKREREMNYISEIYLEASSSTKRLNLSLYKGAARLVYFDLPSLKGMDPVCCRKKSSAN